MKYFIKLLTFLNILESDSKRISITNICVISLLIVISIVSLVTMNIDITAVAALLTVIIARENKRIVENKKCKKCESRCKCK